MAAAGVPERITRDSHIHVSLDHSRPVVTAEYTYHHSVSGPGSLGKNLRLGRYHQAAGPHFCLGHSSLEHDVQGFNKFLKHLALAMI